MRSIPSSISPPRGNAAPPPPPTGRSILRSAPAIWCQGRRVIPASRGVDRGRSATARRRSARERIGTLPDRLQQGIIVLFFVRHIDGHVPAHHNPLRFLLERVLAGPGADR